MTEQATIGIVVPTLGRRADFLRQALESIRAAGDARVVIVAPLSFDATELVRAGLADEKVDEVGTSLPAAINQGVAAFGPSVRYVGWLGDDDLLTDGSLRLTSRELDDHPKAVAVYGACDYVDEAGQIVWRNASGAWAGPLLRVGPDLVPQPGSLFRRRAWDEVGGVATDFGWAFDFDLFLKLLKVGKLRYVRHTLAAFRWHADSLSVGQRVDSVREASLVRKHHLPRGLRPISELWEAPVRWATLHAANLVKGTK